MEFDTHPQVPEAKYTMIIGSVSNSSCVAVGTRAKQTDFWNVPCEWHSMGCTSKYTDGEAEMSSFKVTGASRSQIMCLTRLETLGDRDKAPCGYIQISDTPDCYKSTMVVFTNFILDYFGEKFLSSI